MDYLNKPECECLENNKRLKDLKDAIEILMT